jgi:hypothetical protein
MLLAEHPKGAFLDPYYSQYSGTKIFLFCGLGDDISSHLIFSIIGWTEMYMFAFGFVES